MKAARGARRWTSRVLVTLLFLLCALAVWVSVIHTWDQPLLPDVVATLSRQGEESIEPSDNLFFTALGLGADASEDLNSEGQRIFALYQKKQATTSDITTLVDIYATAGVGKYKPVGDVKALSCVMWRDAEAHHCIVDVPMQRAGWTTIVAANQRLLDRYHRQWTYTKYQDATFLENVLPVTPLGNQSNVRRLFFTSLALQVDRGALGEALQEIEKDLAFWRRLLATRDVNMIDKMIFTVRVRSDLEFISEILRTQTLSADQYDSIAGVLTPNEAAERTFDGVWKNEIRGVRARMHGLMPQRISDIWQDNGGFQGKLDRALSYFLYRPNAQINSDYRFYHLLSETDDLPCSEIEGAFDSLQKTSDFSIHQFLGNPFRYLLGSSRLGGYRDYPMRLCGLEGMQRLVRLQLLIRRNGDAEGDIPSIISSAGPAYADPFTGLPMRWDSSNHTLWFDPRDKGMSGVLPWPI